MPDTPNINSPDVFQPEGEAKVAGGGGGGTATAEQTFYAPGDFTGSSQAFFPLGFGDGPNSTLTIIQRCFVIEGGAGNVMVVRIAAAGTYTIRMYANGMTGAEEVYTASGETFTAGQIKSFDISSVNFSQGDYIGVSLEGATGSDIPGQSYLAFSIIQSS